jgi:hypothetical protein
MPRFTSSAILRTVDWVFGFHSGNNNCVHPLQPCLRYSRTIIPCSYRLCLAESGSTPSYVWLDCFRFTAEIQLNAPGDGQLPEKSASFMLYFSIIFGLLSALKTLTIRRQHWLAKWIPSGVAFAIGFLNTPHFSIARLIGGAMEYVYRTRYARNERDIRLIVIASGFVLGEGVVSILSLVLQTFWVHSISCWGFGHGLCGGCASYDNLHVH